MKKISPKKRRRAFLAQFFTRDERVALAFLLVVGFFGVGILAWYKGVPASPVEVLRLQPVAVNRAGMEELVALPGIGPKTAQRIVEERERHGRYLTLRDLKRVKGISQKTLERLGGLVRFD